MFTEPAERWDDSKKYVLGPSVELGLGSRVGIEVNALYSRFGTTALISGGRSLRGNMWEFPVLGKYYFSDTSAAVRPYAASGFSVRNIWFDDNRSRFVGLPSGEQVGSTEPGIGAVVGAGVSFKAGWFTFSPEVRYTRWGGFNFPATNPNQVQALLGVTF